MSCEIIVLPNPFDRLRIIKLDSTPFWVWLGGDHSTLIRGSYSMYLHYGCVSDGGELCE